MGIQDYNAAIPNAYRSFNVRMRSACAAVSLALPVSVVAASPAPTTTSFALASAALAASFLPGDFLWVMVAGSPVFTSVTSVAGAVITVPALAAAPVAGALVGQTVTWYPEGQKPEKPAYPHVTAQFLRMASYDPSRQLLRSPLQTDVFTNRKRKADAWRIAGWLLTTLGVSLGNHRQFCEIAQADSESGLAIPLLPMELEILGGWEPLGDPDPSMTHLFQESELYHE